MEWTGARYADGPAAEGEILVHAPPRRVWELVSDIALMPRTSGELQSVRWEDGAAGPALGARFTGVNRNDMRGEWETVSHVVEFVPERAFTWAVVDPENQAADPVARPSATWRITLEPADGATRLRHRVRVGPGRSGVSLAIDRMPDREQKIVFVRMSMLESGINTTLDTVRAWAEEGPMDSPYTEG